MAIKVIHIGQGYLDKRGEIKAVLDKAKMGIKSVLYIESKKGSTRGEHYHKKDNHYVYCISGRFRYSQSKYPFKKMDLVVLEPGDLVFTPASHWHSMDYLEDSVMLALATEPRLQSKYEKDTFRLKVSND